MTTIGEMSLWVALVMAAWGTMVSILARSRGVKSLEASGERAIHAVFALLLVACSALLSAMLAHDFSVAHVARFTSANLPRVYLFTAVWAGRETSWLFAILLLASASFLAVVRNRRAARANSLLTAVFAALLTLALGVVCLVLNPFEHLAWTPLEGQGLHPRLQSPGMALHPPILYAGYAATIIPFASGIAGVIDRGMTRDVVASARRWMLAAWTLSATGILLGLWWAYHEPALGSGWFRYAVENCSMLPWAVNTVFLSATALQDRRGRIRSWSITLIIAVFLLSAGASILTIERIAALSSVAATSPSIWIAAMTALGIAAGGYLVSSRVADMPAKSTTSRPDPALRIGLAFIAGAVAAIGVSLAGTSFSRTHDVILQPAQPLAVNDGFDGTWTITSQGTSQYDILNRRVTAIALRLGIEGGRQLVVSSELRQYLDSRRARIFDPSREPGIRGGWLQDVYVVLNEVSENGAASVTVSFNPLIRWFWIGGLLLVLGGVLVFAPRRVAT